MATLIKIIDEGTSHTTATPTSRSHAVQTRVYSGVYTDAQAEDLSTLINGDAHPDDANLICSNPTVTKVGNGIAVATCYFRRASSYTMADPPVLYFDALGVEAVKLPAIDNGNSTQDYGSGTPKQAVFRGHAPKNTYYRVVAKIRARGDDVAAISMASYVSNIGLVNAAAWNGLPAKTVMYDGPVFTVYENGDGYLGRGWLSYTYKNWVDNFAPLKSDPTVIGPHGGVIITDTGTTSVVEPDTAAAGVFPDPFYVAP